MPECVGRETRRDYDRGMRVKGREKGAQETMDVEEWHYKEGAIGGR